MAAFAAATPTAASPQPAHFELDDLGRALAHAPGEIVPRDHQVAGAIVDAAEHDVRVGMAGVEMIDRHRAAWL
jgi:hypothetical protein